MVTDWTPIPVSAFKAKDTLAMVTKDTLAIQTSAFRIATDFDTAVLAFNRRIIRLALNAETAFADITPTSQPTVGTEKMIAVTTPPRNFRDSVKIITANPTGCFLALVASIDLQFSSVLKLVTMRASVAIELSV